MDRYSITATVLTDRRKTNTVAFNRIQDRDDVLRECDGLEINGKKDRFINFLENFHLLRENLLCPELCHEIINPK